MKTSSRQPEDGWGGSEAVQTGRRGPLLRTLGPGGPSKAVLEDLCLRGSYPA